MVTDSQQDYLYLTLNRREAWRGGLLHGLRETETGGLALMEMVQYAPHPNFRVLRLPLSNDAVDFTVGPGPTIYTIQKDSTAIELYDVKQARWFDMLDIRLPAISQPQRLAYHSGLLYVAAAEDERRLSALTEVNWQLVWHAGTAGDRTGRPWPQDEEGKPRTGPLDWKAVDLAVNDSGSLFILDSNEGLIIQLDHTGRGIAVFGHKELQGKEPSALAISTTGKVFVLEKQEKRVYVYKNGIKISEFNVPLQAPLGLAVDADDLLYIGEDRSIAVGAEEDRYIHKFNPQGEAAGLLPVYRGAVHKMIIDTFGDMYIWNREARTIVFMQRQNTLFKSQNQQLSEGYFFSAALDSTLPAVKWHKLVLDTFVPDNAQLEVSYLYSEHKTFYLQGKDQDIDEFISDGAITSTSKTIALNNLNWSEPLLNPHDMLLRGAGGRYLWLRLGFIASGVQSPEVQSIRAVFPRNSYLRYLPAVYQEDEGSRDFLERYLSLFETFLSESEHQIDRIAQWFDADAVSGDYLRWLASWLGVAYDENWTEDKLRLLIKRIPELYRMRGTREGLERLIEIYTGERPFIVEQFQLQCAKTPEVKKLFTRLFGQDPYRFSVLLKTGQIQSESEYRTVRRIIEEDKPAHTIATLTELQPWIYLDRHTYLGVNTFLSEPSSLLNEAVIGQDTMLIDNGISGFVQGKSKVGFDTVLI